MSKNKIFILSDIHIGTNYKTNWYQKQVHEPYLLTALDYVLKNAESTQELILLGDLFDFWTYPADQPVPSFDQIILSNPNIFGAEGKLSQLLSALSGHVTFVNGNHDMNVTQDDLNKIYNPQGYTIKQSSDLTYYPLGNNNLDILCTHGHLYSIFNCPDNEKTNELAPLPFGYFMTRAASFFYENHLEPGQTVVDLPNVGSVPSGWNFASGVINTIISDLKSGKYDVLGIIIDALSGETGLGKDKPILLPNNTTTTLEKAETFYQSLFSNWVNNYGIEKTYYSLFYVDVKDDLSTFAVDLEKAGAKVVVMGHTHIPYRDARSKFAKRVYANSGFNCPSVPDIGKKHPTFVEIDLDGDSYNPSVYKVVNDRGSYRVESWEWPRKSEH